MTAKTGLTTGLVVLLTLVTLWVGAAGASAEDCPEGTTPIVDVDGNPQCVAVAVGGTTPEPTPPPTSPPTPPPTPTPTEVPPPADPSTAPPEEPAPSAAPESAPAVIDPPPVTAPAPPDIPAETPTPTAPASVPPTRSPAQQTETTTPTPAVVPPEQPANAGQTGVIAPGDGPRLLWAVAAGASASGLLAALLAFYLVSVRPFLTARRRPGALG